MKRLPDRYRLLIRLLLVSAYLIASIGSEAHRALHDHFTLGALPSLSGNNSASDHSIQDDSHHDTSNEGIGSSCLLCAHSLGISLVPVVLVESIAVVRQPLLIVQNTGIITDSVSLLPCLRGPPTCS